MRGHRRLSLAALAGQLAARRGLTLPLLPNTHTVFQFSFRVIGHAHRHIPNPSTIRRLAKIFKETGSVKNRKVNRQCYVLTEETLDEIGERL